MPGATPYERTTIGGMKMKMYYQNKNYQGQINEVVDEINEYSNMVAISPGKSRYIYVWTIYPDGLPSYRKYTLGEAWKKIGLIA